MFKYFQNVKQFHTYAGEQNSLQVARYTVSAVLVQFVKNTTEMQTDCSAFMLTNEHCSLCEQVKKIQTCNLR